MEMWKDDDGGEHHPTESEDFPEHLASGMSNASHFCYKIREQRVGFHL
jgi:hypothetical protein